MKPTEVERTIISLDLVAVEQIVPDDANTFRIVDMAECEINEPRLYQSHVFIQMYHDFIDTRLGTFSCKIDEMV